MPKFRFAIDVDDVIANLSGKMPLVIKELYDIDVDASALGCYDLYQLLGISPEQGNEFYNRLCNDFEDIETVEGALEGLQELESRGHDITIVTNRWERETTQAYLESLGISHYPQVFLKFKDPMVDVDFMFDDNPKKLAKLMPWIKEQAFLFNHLQNQFCLDVFNNFTRVNSWQEFMESIDFFEKHLKI